jgi:hypothetical protein
LVFSINNVPVTLLGSNKSASTDPSPMPGIFPEALNFLKFIDLFVI